MASGRNAGYANKKGGVIFFFFIFRGRARETITEAVTSVGDEMGYGARGCRVTAIQGKGLSGGQEAGAAAQAQS